MLKAIICTTIHKPTEAIKKFIKIAHDQDWLFYIVGDLKTPHEEYKKLEDDRVIYISPEYQEKHYPELSDLIGWNNIQRRNFGFIEAYKAGAEIIYTCDDDNIPLDKWGKDIFVNQEIIASDYFSCKSDVFDPLCLEEFWHRGYPIELRFERDKFDIFKKYSKTKINTLVQADLWEGAPDIDAVTRIMDLKGDFFVQRNRNYPFAANKISPFNSQNTFLSRKLFPTYFLFPGIGRFDDIWAAYITQHYFPNSVIYGPPTVFQDRNEHDLVKDLEQELFGYKWTYELIKDLEHWQRFLPEKSLLAYEAYKKEFI
jgi:hypothetical protein